jgi:hypothetical protein
MAVVAVDRDRDGNRDGGNGDGDDKNNKTVKTGKWQIIGTDSGE